MALLPHSSHQRLHMLAVLIHVPEDRSAGRSRGRGREKGALGGKRWGAFAHATNIATSKSRTLDNPTRRSYSFLFDSLDRLSLINLLLLNYL